MRVGGNWNNGSLVGGRDVILANLASAINIKKLKNEVRKFDRIQKSKRLNAARLGCN